jgi:hypothetical protein
LQETVHKQEFRIQTLEQQLAALHQQEVPLSPSKLKSAGDPDLAQFTTMQHYFFFYDMVVWNIQLLQRDGGRME